MGRERELEREDQSLVFLIFMRQMTKKPQLLMVLMVYVIPEWRYSNKKRHSVYESNSSL